MIERPGEKQFVQTESGNYALWRCGKGPLVVLLHGWPVTSYHWRYLISHLSSSGFETIAFDLKGLGESVSANQIFDKPSLANEVWDLLSKIGKRDQCHIIGHDWGGSVALAMAALQTKRVLSVVVEEEVAPGLEVSLTSNSAECYPTWHGAFHRTNLPEQVLSGKEREYISFFLNLRFKASEFPPEDREYYLTRYLTPEKTRAAMEYYRSYSADSSFYQALRNKRIECPTLGIGGEFGMGSAVLRSLSLA
jgi:pimeloyl-ACP methyl ester carboxylesterase